MPKGKRRGHGEGSVYQRQDGRYTGYIRQKLIFPSARKSYMHTAQTLKEFHQLVAQAGLPKMRFYDLRHSAATILLAKGVHPKVVQELLGHSSIAITMNIYSHVMPSMQKEVAGIMIACLVDNLMRNKPQWLSKAARWKKRV